MRAKWVTVGFLFLASCAGHPTIDPPDHAALRLEARRAAESRNDAERERFSRDRAQERDEKAQRSEARTKTLERIQRESLVEPEEINLDSEAGPDDRARYAAKLESVLLDRGINVDEVRAQDLTLEIRSLLCDRRVSYTVAKRWAVQLKEFGFTQVRCYDPYAELSYQDAVR